MTEGGQARVKFPTLFCSALAVVVVIKFNFAKINIKLEFQ